VSPTEAQAQLHAGYMQTVITIVRKQAPAAKVPLDAENPLENLKK